MTCNSIELLSDAQVAELLHVSPSFILRQRFKRRHRLPHVFDIDPVLVGPFPLYQVQDVETWSRMRCSRLERPIGDELVEILPQLRAFARSLVSSDADAKDLVQMTCLRVLERQEQFRPGTSLIAWAITIMRNIRMDELKKPMKFEEVDPEEIFEIPDPRALRRTESRLELRDTLRAIHELPEGQREVIGLTAVGYSYDEIAHKLGIPTGTVMSRLYRGRERLRTLLNR